MSEHPEHPAAEEHKHKTYTRFSLDQRLEHIVFLVSFSTLGLTGLIQKFYASPTSQFILNMLGGVEGTRIVHRVAAVLMLISSIYHILSLGYKVLVKRVSWDMMPSLDDLIHVFQDIGYYLGLRKRKGYYGRYNYAEKAEYLAVVWGTVVMALTGFMMWNPISTARFLPGEFIPAAKAAHGGEAVLAVLAILLWHFYHVHIKFLNKSMFTGKMTHEEMEDEHPAELAQIEQGKTRSEPAPAVLRKRQQIYFPVAASLALVMGFGVWQFVTFESSAITTLPRGETANVYVPITPTPRPTPTPTPIPDPNAPVGADTWDGNYSSLFKNRCSTCHYNTAVGGLRLDSYADALLGGKSGPGIIPGNPGRSTVVTIQQAGGHPGQLSPEEIEQVIQWIEAGAPEK